jgi:hypothetical protein
MSTLFVDTINEKTTNNGVYIPGHVLQVVSATGIGLSTTSTSFVTSNLTATITPSSTSSKILILLNAAMYNSSTGIHSVVTVFRGTVSGTNLGHSSFGFGSSYASGDLTKNNISANYLDSPSTTSATTYTVGIKSESAGTTIISVNGETSTITLMEIAG